MKKRLSDSSWLQPAYCIAVMGILGIVSFAFRAVTVSWNFGVVPAQIPVAHAPIEDYAFHRFESKDFAVIEKNQPMVLLTTKNLYFGSLKSFASGFNGVRNKYVVPHENGSPQLGNLMLQIKKWLADQKAEGLPLSTEVLILCPSPRIPIPILIQVLDYFQKEGTFADTVLAEGLM